MPRFRLFFTPAGAAILVVALVILIRSLLARNSYEIVLSSAMLLLLLIMGVIGFWKSKKLKSLEASWRPPFPMTAGAGEDILITGLASGSEKIPLFFRMHFIVRGRFFSGSEGCFASAETSVSRGEEKARLALDFPMSGVFHGNGFCRLKDIFGFYSFSCGEPKRRTVNVRSSPCFGKDYHVNAQSGAEDKRTKTSSDEERYYMREYTPGDRFRDINWKSSEKIDSLITRISPDNQEKISRIEVYFRNYGPAKKSSLEALWLLDRAKARLSHFLRNLMEQQPSFIFHVLSAGGIQGKPCSWEIEDEKDLDAFLEDLAGLSFSMPQNEAVFPQGSPRSSGELYVFSTACDVGLYGFILACNPRPVSLFFVQPVNKIVSGKDPSSPKIETEILRKRDFPAKGIIPIPRWFLSDKIKQSGVKADRVEMIYTETRL